MRKKIFIITLPSMPIKTVHKLNYKLEDSFVSDKLSFPGLAMFQYYYKQDDIIKIVTVQTATENKNETDCKKLFTKEFADVCKGLDRNFHIDKEILVPAEESDSKQKYLLRELNDVFDDACDIYLDITFGSKLTSVALFSSLVCAEIVHSDSIKSICYGKDPFDGTENGTLFDNLPLYNTIRLMEAGRLMSKKQAEAFLTDMLEE